MSDEPATNTTVPVPACGESFEAFVGPHLPVLWRVARSLCATAHDAEDLVQDTLMRAFRSRATFDGAHARAWLLTIMRNANINHHRRPRPGLLADGDIGTAADGRNPPAASAEDAALSDAAAPWIADALRRLSPKHRAVVRLVDIDGLTYDEAAAALGIPPGTVMSRLHRARQRLRHHLARHPDLWSAR